MYSSILVRKKVQGMTFSKVQNIVPFFSKKMTNFYCTYSLTEQPILQIGVVTVQDVLVLTLR